MENEKIVEVGKGFIQSFFKEIKKEYKEQLKQAFIAGTNYNFLGKSKELQFDDWYKNEYVPKLLKKATNKS